MVAIKNIEMPENCYECLLQGSRGVCLATGREVESKQFECRPDCCPLVPGEPQETVISLMTTITKLTAVINDLTENKDRVKVKTRCKDCEYDGAFNCPANILAATPRECIKMSDSSSYGFCAWGLKKEVTP